MSTKEISVVIIAKNAQQTIGRTLDALNRFAEVILYLNDSTDDTEKIARRYHNVKIIKGAFRGFGPTKNIAASHATHPWILSLDSDEILPEALVDEIDTIDLGDTHTLYQLHRDNYFLGYKTQNSDTIIRIYHKAYTRFNDNRVHEKIIVPPDARIESLKTHFIHLNITDINQTLTKIIHYTDLGAEGKQTCFFGTVIAKAMFAFFKTYILQGNIVRGWVGFALAINSANKRYYKYLKQYIHCKKEEK